MLFNYSCLHFLPIPPLHPSQSHLCPFFHPSPWFCPCVLYSSSWKPFSPLSPPPSPLASVTLFWISMSLVIFCLHFSFVDYVSVKGEIIWYLSLTAWLTSLSIILSSSIHAVAKGISLSLIHISEPTRLLNPEFSWSYFLLSLISKY